MNALASGLAILLLSASAKKEAKPTPPPTARLIVPERRLGPIHRNTRRTDLARLFPKAKIEEGGCGPEDADAGLCGATVISMGAADVVTLFWMDERQLHPARASVSGRAWGWKTAEGISAGMSLEELMKLLGAIRYHPWHPGTDPENGKLYDWTASPLSRLEGKLSIWVGPADGTCEQDESMLTGQLPADLDALEPCDPIVSRLGIEFNPPER